MSVRRLQRPRVATIVIVCMVLLSHGTAVAVTTTTRPANGPKLTDQQKKEKEAKDEAERQRKKGPDLIVSELADPPRQVRPGSTFTVTDKVKNVGETRVH